MVANITSGSNFYGAAAYNQKKVNSGEAAILYKQYLRGTSPKAIDNSFQNLNHSDIKKPVLHASLSFAYSDKAKLTNEKILNITKEYVEKTGYGNQPYIVYLHNDTEHPHVHILTSRVNIETQKKINDSNEFRKSKDITDKLETKYSLAISDPKNLLKKEISAEVNNVFQKTKPESIKTLNKELSKINSSISIKAVGNGIYFKDDNWKRIAPRGLKSSLFKAEGLDKKSIEERFENNRNDRLHVKESVEKVLAKSPKINTVTFEKELKSDGIEVNFRKKEGDNEEVIGVTYTYKDHSYNGSKLDRSLSFNNTKDQIVTEAISSKDIFENVEKQRKIEMDFDGNTVQFDSSNKNLDKQLTNIPQRDAIDLSTKINTHIDDYKYATQVDRKIIKSLVEKEVDEYNQKRYKAKEKENERQQKM